MSTDAIIGFTLDRSGSTANIWEDIEGGFNHFKNDQAQVEGRAWIILTAFDSDIDEVYHAWDARHIPDLPEIATDHDEIGPRGSTALLDATAKTIHRTQKWLDDNPWFNGKVIQVIATDGYENASREYTNERLKNLIESKKDQGWDFIYLAANVDAWATGGAFGINPGDTVQYNPDARSVGNTYSTLSAAVTGSRTGERDVSDGYFDDDEQNQ